MKTDSAGGNAARRRFREILLSVTASAVVLLVFCLLLEVTLRTTHLFGAATSWVQPDPDLGWRYTPEAKYWFHRENDHPIEGRINRFGWRDYERRLEKQEGTYRVAVLGDSYVTAFQVELDSTFLPLAEDRLRRDFGLDVELMNFGRQGMTQTEEYLVLQDDVMQFSPDMVALLFLPYNDVRDIAQITANSTIRPFPEIEEGGGLKFNRVFNRSFKYEWRARLAAIRRRSALVSLIVERLTLLKRTRRLTGTGPETNSAVKISDHLSLCTASPDLEYVHNYELNRALIGAMAEFCKKKDTAFMLMCSDFAAGADEEARYQAIDPTFDPDFFDKNLRALADSLDVDYLGFQAPFRSAITETGDPHHWVHWNYSGHQVAADALALKLAELLRRD